MPTVSNLTQYIGKGVVQGFVSIVPPAFAFSRPATGVNGSPITAAGLNDVVRIGLAQAGTASADFTYAGGYTGNNGNIAFKTATLGNVKYQPLTLTDSEIIQLGSEEAAITQGFLLGQQLGADVVSHSFASSIPTLSGANTSSKVSTDFASGMSAPADLDNFANTKNWPRVGGQRYLISGTTLWNNMMQNSSIVAASNFGYNNLVAQTGNLNSLLGFTPYLANVTLPQSLKGFACTPNFLNITTVYHAPQSAAASVVNDSYQLKDPQSGFTLGYYEYYSPATRTLSRVYDCLFGSTVLDATAFYGIK